MSGSPTADRLTADRWHRFGHDRLYVRRDGTPIGWWDLSADVPHPSANADVEALHTALALWRDGQLLLGAGPVRPPGSNLSTGLPAVPATPGVLAAGSPPDPSPVPERDLAGVPPGTALLAQAAALRSALAPPATPAPCPPAETSWLRRLLTWALGPRPAPHPPVEPILAAERPWLVGAAGEQQVGAALTALTQRDPLWQALHSIRIGRSGADLDHLVMGPGGVFTLDTKHHQHGSVWVGGDVVLVNGRYRPYVHKSRHQAARASQVLSAACGFAVPVRGLVVTVGARLTVKAPPEDVVVLDEPSLTSWLTRQPTEMSTATLGWVHAAARRESTWTTGWC